jgi:hypothetical protein
MYQNYNQNLGNCQKCGAPLAMSKAGKQYCSAKCWLRPRQYSPNEKRFAGELDNSVVQQRIDSRIEQKDANIRWMNSLNNASLIVSALIKSGKVEIDSAKIKISVEELANWYNNISAKSIIPEPAYENESPIDLPPMY